MTPSEFIVLAERTLTAVEQKIEALADEMDVDIEMSRAGNVLTLELPAANKIIMNLQEPLQEIWLAARSGGFHFRYQEPRWVDTRSGEELFAMLVKILAEQTGKTWSLII